MQVVINRSALLTTGDVPIYCTLDDDAVFDAKQFPQGAVCLRVEAPSVSVSSIGNTLTGNWREMNKEPIVINEAEARILEVFPANSQLAAMQELLGYVLSSGADASRWPSNAQRRKAEIDRCMNYANSVRARAKQMTSAMLSGDPTQDSRWPTKIAPYVPM